MDYSWNNCAFGGGVSMFLSDEMEEKRPEAIIDQKR